MGEKSFYQKVGMLMFIGYDRMRIVFDVVLSLLTSTFRKRHISSTITICQLQQLGNDRISVLTNGEKVNYNE